MHSGFGYHQACNGSVVACGADHFNSRDQRLRSVQFTGTAQVAEPAAAEPELFGPVPHFGGGELFDPVCTRVEPQFITVHSPTRNAERAYRHALRPASLLRVGAGATAGATRATAARVRGLR
ncbi:hypothetical protein GCM10010343_48380 [Streptomyces avidinii]|uniref:Uncharacterized protein n=1 Tax=Streptomyces avidinii TaxID=1895 RepID=A0ABS4LF94_STRAV|nr:hypothetical protein [Streptomyces avidinii]GGZ15801.1 hypothetical protein GCM10010343_48380 [Streptomyces avidinii]